MFKTKPYNYDKVPVDIVFIIAKYLLDCDRWYLLAIFKHAPYIFKNGLMTDTTIKKQVDHVLFQEKYSPLSLRHYAGLVYVFGSFEEYIDLAARNVGFISYITRATLDTLSSSCRHVESLKSLLIKFVKDDNPPDSHGDYQDIFYRYGGYKAKAQQFYDYIRDPSTYFFRWCCSPLAASSIFLALQGTFYDAKKILNDTKEFEARELRLVKQKLGFLPPPPAPPPKKETPGCMIS